MKAAKRPQILRTSVAALVTLLVSSPMPVKAGTGTWTGAVDNTWNNAGNWSFSVGGPTPGSDPTGSNLTFAGSANTNPNNNNTPTGGLPPSLVYTTGLTFASGAATFQLTGNAIFLEAGGAITNNSSNLQIVNFTNDPSGSLSTPNSGIQLTGQDDNFMQVIGATNTINAASGNIEIDNNVSFALPLTLILTGDGHQTTIKGAFVPAGAGTLAMVKNGTGVTLLSGASTYTGPTTVNAGVLAAGVATVGGESPTSGAFGISSAVTVTTPGIVDLNGFNTTIGSLAGSGSVTDGSGLVTGSTAGAATLITGTDNTSTTFSGVLSNGTSGALSLTKAGTGTQTLSGANTYTGLTTVDAGVLNIQNSAALGTAAAGTTVTAGATLQVQGGINVAAEALTLNGTGAAGQSGALVNVGGNNTYGGPITLGSAATISSDSGSLNVTGAIAGGGNALTLGGASSGTVSSVIGPTVASLTKSGAGTWILTGTNTYTGPTMITAGTLQVDGSIASTSTSVSPGAILQGMGSIGGGVTNSGTVKPGGSSATGTLAVGGNYTQTSTGNLRIGLASTSTYGRLRVGGTANLGGSLTAVSVNGFHPSAGDSFTILTATGGVNGKFGTVNDLTGAKSTSLLKFEVVYDPNDVKLTYVQGTVTGLLDSFTGECRDHVTPNQRSVAAALDDVIDNHKLSKLFKYLDKDIGCDQILSDLDRIAPEEISSIYNLAAELETVQMQNIQRRTEAIRSGAGGFSAAGLAVNGGGPSYSGPIGFRTGMDSPANNEPVAFRTGVAGPNGDDGKESKEMKQVAPYDPRMGVFLTGVGQWINVGDTFNARGFDLTTGGFTLGLDYKLTPNLAVGITAGYANTSVDLNNGGDIDVNGGKLGLYATYFTGGFYVDTAVTGGYNSYDTRRSALQGDARGSTDGGELNVLVATGYDVHVGGLTFGPTASFQYTYTGLSGFTETGSLAPLTYDSQSKESYRTAFGAKASYDWKVGGVIIKPEVSLAWQHEFGDSSYGVDSRFAVAGGNFSVFGPEVGRDSLLLDAGVAIQWNERTSTYVYYTGDLGRTNEQANSVSGGVTVAF